MSPVYGVLHPVSMVLWCCYGISDGFVENHILFCVRGSYFFICFADNCLDLFCLIGLLVVRFIPEFGIIFCAVFLLVSWVHILVWFWGWFGRHVWSNKKHLNYKCYHRKLGAVSIRKTVLPGMAIPMLKIRRPNGRLIFNMEIAIHR